MCGNLNLERDEPAADLVLFRLAFAKGLHGQRVPPMRPVPLVWAPGSCAAALWGWPKSKGIHTHARHETAATLPTWSAAWHERRGVVPVTGWHEGSWQVDAPGAHLAVLWISLPDGPRLVVLTQESPTGSPIDRFPIPLTQDGALAWMAGGGLDDQVRDPRLGGVAGQQSLFGDG